MSKLGARIIKSHHEDNQNPERLEELVEKLTEVVWVKSPDNPWMQSQAGFAGQAELYRILYRLVYSNMRPWEANDTSAESEVAKPAAEELVKVGA